MKTSTLGTATFALWIVSNLAEAQTKTVELTPFVGYQVGGATCHVSESSQSKEGLRGFVWVEDGISG